MIRSKSGFTLVEVLIAVVLLGVGLLVLAGSAAGVTRMLSNGSRKTRSFSVAASLLDSLRNTSKTSCGSLAASGSGTNPGGISKAWTVSNAGSTSTNHTVTVTTSYRVGPYTKGDTLITTIYC